MLVSLEMGMLILFPKLEAPCLLWWSVVPLPSYRQTCHTHSHKWRRHISTFPLPSQLPRSYRFSGEISPLRPHMP